MTNILEGLMTTLNPDGEVNISPMGPIVDADMHRLLFRPYQTSTTYQNLKRTGEGVFHVSDNVEMLARAAVGQLDDIPEFIDADGVEGRVLADCCRWYAVKVRILDDSRPRTEIVGEVVETGRRRDFFGFNRAKHAVVEAAILATRIEFLPAAEIRSEFERLRVPVQKTGGAQEVAAFEFLDEYVQNALSSQPC